MQIQNLFKNMVVYSSKEDMIKPNPISRFLPGLLHNNRGAIIKRNDSGEAQSSDYDTCPSDEGFYSIH